MKDAGEKNRWRKKGTTEKEVKKEPLLTKEEDETSTTGLVLEEGREGGGEVQWKRSKSRLGLTSTYSQNRREIAN